jgi:drug/metabolite transporter (DMT)-like permease
LPLTGILAGLAAGALWGLVFVVPQLAPGFSDADLTAGRFGVYGLIGLVALLVRGPRLALTMLLSRHAAMACLLSFLGFGAYSLCLLEAIRQGGSEVSAMVVGTLPVWMMLLGRPKGLGWSRLWPGALVTCAGLMLMTWSRRAGADTLTESVSAAWGLACLATFCWLVYALLNSCWLRRYP